ncbi:hypothetical protein DQ384_07540 [Sphaerisporangium album]|uniref:Uncharacterized protein n=1 Tax=Sphaerisporangium album TaxID=509200 RepID=A0A367FR05_9ACTN|nr:hypothetical protein [Sphaerisporangium album]RCG32339.1 hypothetical protein DQ384_07540 [Sphaerisporangium album]
MTNFSASRLLAPVRHGAVVLALAALAGCGLAGVGGSGGDATPSAQVNGGATTAPVESTPVPSESTPVESTPAQTESTPVQPESTPVESGTADKAAAPVAPGGTLVDGSTVSSELTRAGQKDKFTLDLGDAREFWVTDMEGADIQFQVFSEVDGEPLGPAPASLSYGTSLFKLTKVGGHRLEVWGGTNVVGPYSFRIATVKVRTFPAAIGLKIGEGSPAGAGRLDPPGRIDRFEFDADGATAIKIIGGQCGDIAMELFDAAQKSVAEARQPYPLCGNEFEIPLASGTGRYALVVRSPAAKAGTYSFQIVRAG